jgi:outer membrane protein
MRGLTIAGMSLLPAMRVACAALLAAQASAAHAQQAGDFMVHVGWLHVGTLGTTTDVHTDLRPGLAGPLLGVPDSFDSPGLSSTPHSVNTLGLSSSWFVTDHVALELDAGVPPEIAVDGRGIAAPPGLTGQLFRVDLGDPAVNPLGTARQWSPALVLHYRFGEDSARLRPFVGAGVAYTWFTGERLNPAFADALNNNFGRELALAALKPGPTTASTRIAPAFAPVVNAGVTWSPGGAWSLTPTLAYVPLSTTTEVVIDAADGTRLATTHAKVRAKALLSALVIDYRF